MHVSKFLLLVMLFDPAVSFVVQLAHNHLGIKRVWNLLTDLLWFGFFVRIVDLWLYEIRFRGNSKSECSQNGYAIGIAAIENHSVH